MMMMMMIIIIIIIIQLIFLFQKIVLRNILHKLKNLTKAFFTSFFNVAHYKKNLS